MLLLKTGLSLIGIVLKPLVKSVLISLGLTTVASATDAAIYKKCLDQDVLRTQLRVQQLLIISNEEMYDIMKIAKSLEESGLLIAISITLAKQLKMK